MPATRGVRDAYGFEVKREYLELYQKYAPLWEKEETERAERWASFLSQFDEGNAAALPSSERQSAELEVLERELSSWRHADRGRGSLEAPPWQQQLRSLVQAGVPMAFRGKMWKILLDLATKRKAGVYDRLVVKALGKKHRIRRRTEEAEVFMPAQQPDGGPEAGPSPGDGALEGPAPAPPAPPADGPDGVAGGSPPVPPSAPAGTGAGPGAAGGPARAKPGWHPSCRDWNLQIEKDLHRTFPGHPVMDSSGRSALRRILAAYARRNPSVGYCQGMNFIAGCLLLFMDEEDAFWALAAIVEDLLPGYFSLAMVAPQVDQLVFKAMVDSQFTSLAAHLEAQGVSVSSVSTQWFLCIFVNSLPLETCLRVWDVFFFECCSSVLFRVALALVDIYNQALLATTDSVDAFSLLQHMAPMSYDSSRLVDVACIGFAHITYRHLNSLRALYFAQVAQLVQEAGTSDDVAACRHTSDEVELTLPRRAASTPNYFAEGPPSETDGEALSSPTALQEADGFQLVPPVSRPGLLPFDVKMDILELSEGESPRSSRGGQAESSSPSPPGSPEAAESAWHDTPVWPDITTFSQHTLRHLSKLSNVTVSETDVSSLASPTAMVSSGEVEGEGGHAMKEDVYRNAAARTARLAAGLPAIQVSSSPAEGAPLDPPNVAMSDYLWGLLMHGGTGEGTAATSTAAAAGLPPPQGPAAPAGAPALEHASRSEAAAVAFEIAATPARYSGTGSEGDGAPGAPSPTPTAAGSTSGLSIAPEHGESAGPVGGGDAADGLPPVGTEARSADEGERGDPRGQEGAARGGSPPPGQDGDLVRDEGLRRGTLDQLLGVVEGLENELFLAEARRHEAEVAADALGATAEGLRAKLQAAQTALAEKWGERQALEASVAHAGREASAAEKAAAIQAAAVTTAQGQLALRDSLLAEKDYLIEGLQRKAGLAPENAGMRFLRGLTRFRLGSDKSAGPDPAAAPQSPLP